jgi:cytidylate kinase
MSKLTIAIDGFSSGGKSTFARAIAARLGYVFIDSGAMYRAVTLFALEHGFFAEKGAREQASGGGKTGTQEPETGAQELDEAALIGSLSDISLSFKFDPAKGSSDIFLNGKNVSAQIRSIEVSNLVSRVSSIGAVRQMLVNQQRTMGRQGGVVMDGRDIGTVVFPDADLKIFLTADPAVRAKRRFEELRAAGHDVSLADVEQNIRQRDIADQTREISPLRQAPDAKVLDNSNLTLDQQMDWVERQLAGLR